MAEDKAKSSPDEAGGNDSKVFSLFCLKSILIWLGDADTYWWPLILNGYLPYCPDSDYCSLFMDKVVFFLNIVQKELNYYFQK